MQTRSKKRAREDEEPQDVKRFKRTTHSKRESKEEEEEEKTKRKYVRLPTGFNNRLQPHTPTNENNTKQSFDARVPLTLKKNGKEQTEEDPIPVLKEEHKQLDFESDIPHHVETKQHENIKRLLQRYDPVNKNVVLLFDYPGVGKTQTITKITKELGRLHILIPVGTSRASASFRSAMSSRFSTYCEQPKSDADVTSITILYSSVLIITILEEALTYIRSDPKTSVFTSTGNGFHNQYKRYEDLALAQDNNKMSTEEAMAGLIDARFKRICEDLIVVTGAVSITIHLDEVHMFNRAEGFKRPPQGSRNVKIYDKETPVPLLETYTLVGLSRYLYSITNEKLNVVISGTSSSVKNAIVVDSEVKPYDEVLRYSTLDDVIRICNMYLNLDTTDENVRCILNLLCGPFRRTQHFLRFISNKCKDYYIRRDNDKKNLFTMDMLRSAVSASYSDFKHDVSDKMSNDEIKLYVNDMMFCGCLPRLFSGMSGHFDYNSGEFFNSVSFPGKTQNATEFDEVPSQWTDLQDKSLARWVRRNGKFYLIKPYTQLLMYYNEKCHDILKDKDFNLRVLTSKLQAHTGNTGAHGFSFQYAVAYELTVRNIF